ncbi:MAG: exodeoxyribonuclease VII large subunit [Bacteroidales bacterium]|nr:exodeoxyribonuclease VII large subunit [Bacteroidales bacterium]
METSAYTLLQLNQLIKKEISTRFQKGVLLIAEIHSISARLNGHAYLDLVEKSENGDQIVAQLKATIWSNVFRIIKPYFETTTGRKLEAGLKIMVNAQISFHEIYGLSANITAIYPEHTIGDLALQRQKTIEKLKNEGVIDMNKSLELPMLIKNIAVISSAGAAGYGDFVNQLNNNQYGYKFNTYLFEATVQGKDAENSIINQLERISNLSEIFDCIALIRGGGSKTDLNCFDNYILCQNLCQVPIPIITGIGHDRDESVADIVANTHLKTPTAVAQFIIDRACNCENLVNKTITNIQDCIKNKIEISQNKHTQIVNKIQYILSNFSTRKENNIDKLKQQITNNIKLKFHTKNTKLKDTIQNITYKSTQKIKDKQNQTNNIATKTISNIKNKITEKNFEIDKTENTIKLNNPQNILKKGYSYTKINNQIIKSTSQLQEGDTITTIYSDGKTESKITKKYN